jgi:hypothetical protein
MPATAADVLAGRAAWSCERSDALAWLRGLPDGCASLTMTSPPYEGARQYGIGFKLWGQAWADWLRPVVAECCRVTAGLVCVNMAGVVRKHRYSAAVEFLVADLVRLDGLCCGPSPYAWVRPGIAGSGNKVSGYHRRNFELVYCFARPEHLPLRWHDQLAFGRPPKFGPGGEFSHRNTNGTRVNQWGRHPGGGKSVKANGQRQTGDRPSHTFVTRKKTATKGHKDGDLAVGEYTPPVIANPGNVIRTGNGGNQCGHPMAHENEAPMNLALAERFVFGFAPPGGRVSDPFCGSGTTPHAAVLHGRTFLGCDVRQSQVDLTERRMRTVTPALC